ncbi:MBL fold metallo-hydrolase [Candidatus Sumerlaeota bacterium]|nr:MBL fold metallo-hydrolase [Candidatus Sumerlaeota bacterium]
MYLEFWGAARSTTGSMHLLGLDGKRFVLDCGLFQGRREESWRRNRDFPYSPASFDSAILSHAHIDHSGNLPNFAKQGFKGKVFATTATADLCQIMLRDSAHVQESDIAYVNKKHAQRGQKPFKVLYTADDAERVIGQFESAEYGRSFAVSPQLECTFLDAGHILGAAVVVLDITENTSRRRIVFSGDLGRRHLPILRDPEAPDWADVLILESTYGDRRHENISAASDRVREVVARVVERQGKITVPAFAVGRAQEFVYCLHRLFEDKKLPRVPVFVDSPLARDATEVFRRHRECWDADALRMLETSGDVFGFSGLRYVGSVEESKALNDLVGPCVIISASGMCEAGRILHHLKNNIEDPRNCVLVIGYMAENTLGRKIVERQSEVKIFGETYRLRAEVAILNSFSAHGDSDDLSDFARRIAGGGRLRKVFIVHGEPERSMPLVERLRIELSGVEVYYPERGERYDL